MITEYRLDSRIDEETSIALGYFDGVHIGHRAVIAAAVKDGYAPCVFTFSVGKEHPEGKTGGLITMPEHKAELIEAMGVKYMICPDFGQFRNMTGKAFVRHLKKQYNAAHLYCGEDFRFGAESLCTTEELKAYCMDNSIGLTVIDRVTAGGSPVSSTRIRESLAEGDIKNVNEMLGRHYSIKLEVGMGRQLGRVIGVPTINQTLPHSLALPKFGVYASYVKLEEKTFPSITDIGIKPTVGSEAPLAETHIIGYAGDLYGSTVEVKLYDYLREEIKFGSLELLKNRIESDIEKSLVLYGQNTVLN